MPAHRRVLPTICDVVHGRVTDRGIVGRVSGIERLGADRGALGCAIAGEERLNPSAVLRWPLLFVNSAPAPEAVFWDPPVSVLSAWKPTAVLLNPVVTEASVPRPTAVLRSTLPPGCLRNGNPEMRRAAMSVARSMSPPLTSRENAGVAVPIPSRLLVLSQ